jgi:hypothetical protein
VRTISALCVTVFLLSGRPAFGQSPPQLPVEPGATAAPKTTPTSSYIYVPARQNGQPCDAATPADFMLVQEIVKQQLREIAPVSETLPDATSPAPADPLSLAVAELRGRAKTGGKPQRGFASLYKHNVVVTTLCKNGQIDNVSSTGYALILTVDYKREPNEVLIPTVLSGSTVSGSLAAVQANDWSNVFGDTKPKNVPYLPVFGDNADVINGQLEQRLPLVVPKDVTNIVDLCFSSTYHLVVAGQGSLAYQALDPYRSVLAVGTTAFTQPAPWSSVYKALGAAFALIGIPTSQEIKADIFVCDPSGLYSLGSTDQSKGAFDVTGHNRRLAAVAASGTRNAVLAYALNDLQNQLDCIIHRWSLDKWDANRAIYPKPPYSIVATSRWCGIKDKAPGYYDALKHRTDFTKPMIRVDL